MRRPSTNFSEFRTRGLDRAVKAGRLAGDAGSSRPTRRRRANALISEEDVEFAIKHRLERHGEPIARPPRSNVSTSTTVASSTSMAAAPPIPPGGRDRKPRTMFDTLAVDQMVQIIAGQAICDDVPEHDGQRLDVQLGMCRRCVVGVPPVIEVLVGGLAIWRSAPPSAVSETGYRLELQRLAMQLAAW
jgi:hypothetical protein